MSSTSLKKVGSHLQSFDFPKNLFSSQIFSISNNSLQAANNTFAGSKWPAGRAFEAHE